MYSYFLEQGKNAADWREPLFDFLKDLPKG